MTKLRMYAYVCDYYLKLRTRYACNRLTHLAHSFFRPALSAYDKFIPGFVEQSKRRIEELTSKLGQMPTPLANDNEREIAFLVIISRAKELLKDLLANRIDKNDEPVCGEGTTTPVNIVRDVTAKYKTYAANITKVSVSTLHLYGITQHMHVALSCSP